MGCWDLKSSFSFKGRRYETTTGEIGTVRGNHPILLQNCDLHVQVWSSCVWDNSFTSDGKCICSRMCHVCECWRSKYICEGKGEIVSFHEPVDGHVMFVLYHSYLNSIIYRFFLFSFIHLTFIFAVKYAVNKSLSHH